MLLSVLDQSPIPAGSTAADALRNTLDLARVCDRLGYRRYWLAEHHNSLALAGTAPEILIGHVASVTERLRVGSGGVMLSHYSSLKVAESFRMLHALHPGRIDLGIGRAPGSDPRTAVALMRGSHNWDEEDFPNQIQDLLGWLEDRLGPDHPFAGVHAQPASPGAPEVWVLGSTRFGAACAAHFGLPFSFAYFIAPEAAEAAMETYRSRFQPSSHLAEPMASAGVSVICAPTDEEADRLASSIRLWRMRLYRGDPGPVPTVEEALAYNYSSPERAQIKAMSGRLIYGSPGTCKARLDELAARLGLTELVIVSICHDHRARVRSYELLADVFDLAREA